MRRRRLFLVLGLVSAVVVLIRTSDYSSPRTSIPDVISRTVVRRDTPVEPEKAKRRVEHIAVLHLLEQITNSSKKLDPQHVAFVPTHASDSCLQAAAAQQAHVLSDNELTLLRDRIAVEERTFCHIEDLDPENEFRRPFITNRTIFVESREHILPLLLGNFLVPMESQRVVYIDIGSHSFRSSIDWFFKHYPRRIDSVFAYELEHNRTTLPARNDILDHTRTIISSKQYRNIHLHSGVRVESAAQCHSGSSGSTSEPCATLKSILFAHANVTKDDFVILKFDIEGGEYEVFEEIFAESPEILSFIDEMFIEVHYRMRRRAKGGAISWSMFRAPRTQAVALLEQLRSVIDAVHPWP